MKKIFTQAFKIQAVEKVLNKTDNTTVKEVADLLGISISSLNRWTLQAKNHEFEAVSTKVIHNMTQDKRPQDWTLEERFNMVLSCNTLDDEALSEHCRARGIYPHHHWCLRHWWYCRTALSFDERKSLLLT